MSLLRQKLQICSLLLIFLSSCSSRVEYQSTLNDVPPSSDSININTATYEDLRKLPTIGPKTAESIVLFREENGPFRRAEHIMLIQGISESRFLKMRAYIRIE